MFSSNKRKATNQYKRVNLKKRITNTLNKIVSYKLRKKRIQFESFISNNINTKGVYTDSNIGDSVKDIDIFICGSDQIWNPDWFKSAFFLDFVPDNKKKIAYAASLGRNILSIQEKALISPLINRLNYISVREESAKELLKDDVNKEISIVLDPTLLLDKTYWNALSGEYEKNGEYIFVYLLGNNPAHRHFAENLAKKMKKRIICLPYSDNKFNKGDAFFNAKKIYSAGPIEFLQLIKNADYIITDSFHAVVFSIIFNKEFYVVNRSINNDIHSMNSRIFDLLHQIKLENRIINNFNTSDFVLNEETIDYNSINNYYNEKRSESIKYLRNTLGS
jgi:Polysaccharide pyruvyl transferase.